MIKKPMLAGKLESVSDLKFPVYVTPKLDGIRCIKIHGKALSRKLIEIPNRYIQKMMSSLPDGLDGELILEGKSFNESQSAIMTEDGEPDFSYYIFDYVTNDLKESYLLRTKGLSDLSLPNFCKKLIPKKVDSLNDFISFEQKCLSENYEGVMLRTASGPYKCGRSTEKEGYLLKYKRFEDSDAEIIGYERLKTNNNEQETDNLGNTKRSKKKAGLEELDLIGSLLVKDIHSGIEFSIGSGFTEDLRLNLWKNKESLLGKIIKYQFQPAGAKEKPRFPTFISFRDKRDL